MDEHGGLTAGWVANWEAEPRLLLNWLDSSFPALSTEAMLEGSSRGAGVFAALGLSQGDRVAWVASSDSEALVALVSLLRLGCVICPINPGLPARELFEILDDFQPCALVGSPAARVDLPAKIEAFPYASAVAPVACTLDQSHGEEPVMVVYSSGTTGKPKGIVHSHRSLLAGQNMVATSWEWEQDQLFLCLPLFHVHGLVVGLMGALASSGGALLAPRFSPELLGEAAHRGASMFFGVPTMYHRLLEAGLASDLAHYRLVVSGSAPLTQAMSEAVMQASGQVPLERYGMTETLLTVTNPLHGERRPGAIGLPFPGVEIRVDDDEELWVKTPALSSGIWAAANTATLDHRDWFATGDLAVLGPDGYVKLHGRRSDLIITGGFNVYPAEIEAVISQEPSVIEVAVLGVSDNDLGQKIVAFVVSSESAGCVERVQALCASELSRHKQPRAVVILDQLPRNAMGKVLRRELSS